jgi:amidase
MRQLSRRHSFFRRRTRHHLIVQDDPINLVEMSKSNPKGATTDPDPVRDERPKLHHVGRMQHQFGFDPKLPPVARVAVGDEIVFETNDDAYERLSAGETIHSIGMESFNAVSGPVEIMGARPGDTLQVDILAIEMRRAWLVWLPGFGALGDRTRVRIARQCVVRDGDIELSARLSVPLRAMVGCIGVAPASGVSSSLSPAYPWGGNMDLAELTAGASIQLPVQAPGAMLSLGDLHASMGQAECASVAIEGSGLVRVRVGLLQGDAPPYPRLRVGSETICLGMGSSWSQAAERAVDQAFELLQRRDGLSAEEAYAYVCAAVGLRLGGPACAIVGAVVPDPKLRSSSA